ncbi:MAG: hypothetical protein ACREUJ_00150 [Burkholderiales bacterium]
MVAQQRSGPQRRHYHLLGAKGKQYVAVMTGWGGLTGDDYGSFFGGTFAQMPKDSGVIKMFALP